VHNFDYFKKKDLDAERKLEGKKHLD